MAYEFKTLGSVEALTEVPENANALIEVDGAIKRVPGGALGNKKDNGNNEEYARWDYVFSSDDYNLLGQTSGVSSFLFIKGDMASLIDDLLTGKLPAVCVKDKDDNGYANYYIPFHIEASYGSGYCNINLQFYISYNGEMKLATMYISSYQDGSDIGVSVYHS